MSVDFTFRPLDHATWGDAGGRPGGRRSCQFRAPYSKTMSDLRAELRRIRVREAVIEIDVDERDIRLDGLPRSDARPNSPRVRLSFAHPSIGPLQYPCDTYPSWQDNLRAIAKTLEAQRAMDRYGATRHHQQYAGWKQLPGAIQLHGAMTVEAAARFIASCPGWGHDVAGDASRIMADRAYYKSVYRHAAKTYHPDAGGTTEQFNRLQEAKSVLDTHFGT